MPHPRPARTAALLAALLAAASCALAVPAIEETPERIILRNAHLTVSVGRTQGGTIAELRTADGALIASNHGLYTDRGIYGEGVYVGSGSAPVEVQTRLEGNLAVVEARGVLGDREGKPPAEPGAIPYWVRHTLGEEPALRVEWGIRPAFSLPLERGFFAYILGIAGCAGLFANTEPGVLLQDMGERSTRTYQSAAEPLSPQDPWLGLVRGDGLTVAFTDLAATPAFSNVFLHEDGQGGAAVFFAWLDGVAPAGLALDGEWRGAFTLRLAPSFGAFRPGGDEG